MTSTANLIVNRPASEPVRKGARVNDCASASEPRGYRVEPLNTQGKRYTVRALSNVYASATAEEWDAYNAAVACFLTWTAQNGESTLDHDRAEYEAAREVMRDMHARAYALRAAESADDDAPRIDNAPAWALVDMERAPRGVMLPLIGAMLHTAAVVSALDSEAVRDRFNDARESLRAAKEERKARRAAAKRAANMNAAQSAIAALDAEQLEQLRAFLAAQANA